MTEMTYEEFVNSDRFETYIQDRSAWEELPPQLQAQVAGTGANILGIALTNGKELQDTTHRCLSAPKEQFAGSPEWDTT